MRTLKFTFAHNDELDCDYIASVYGSKRTNEELKFQLFPETRDARVLDWYKDVLGEKELKEATDEYNLFNRVTILTSEKSSFQNCLLKRMYDDLHSHYGEHCVLRESVYHKEFYVWKKYGIVDFADELKDVDNSEASVFELDCEEVSFLKRLQFLKEDVEKSQNGYFKNEKRRFNAIFIQNIESGTCLNFQQKIVKIVCKMFPDWQIIATTQSPVIVRSVPTKCIRVFDLEESDRFFDGQTLGNRSEHLAAQVQSYIDGFKDIPFPEKMKDRLSEAERLRNDDDFDKYYKFCCNYFGSDDLDVAHCKIHRDFIRKREQEKGTEKKADSCNE